MTFKRISAKPKNVYDILNREKYTIDYYQREYKWETSNIVELLRDLEERFWNNYGETHLRPKVAEYSHYFLGTLVFSEHGDKKYIIDGQQRMTSLTLLLIFLRHLQRKLVSDDDQRVPLDDLIYSAPYGTRTYNLEIDARADVMEALFKEGDFDANGKEESIRNLVGRYGDIEEYFFTTQDEITDTQKVRALPFFINWVIQKVDFVEIIAASDDEAYAVFETMNSRGVPLTPTEMLKGYLLANIEQADERNRANDIWANTISSLQQLGKNQDSDFVKTWLRAKYAQSMRKREKDSKNEDFELISSQFHKWVKEHEEAVGLSHGNFYTFIKDQFTKFADYYRLLIEKSQRFDPEYEYVFYNAYNNFTFQYLLALAPLKLTDSSEIIKQKINLVTGFVDIFIARRIVNFRALSYSSVAYTMFNIMKEIRNLDVDDLTKTLRDKIKDMDDEVGDEKRTTFAATSEFYMHQQNKRLVHYLLARMTAHLDRSVNGDDGKSFWDYVRKDRKGSFEVEHLWADKPERHIDEFSSAGEFSSYRNRFGGLILLPRGKNQSLNAAAYEEKLNHYLTENLLAKSLHPQYYTREPLFRKYREATGLPFQSHDHFKKADLDLRQDLYRQICEEIWSPARFDRELVDLDVAK